MRRVRGGTCGRRSPAPLGPSAAALPSRSDTGQQSWEPARAVWDPRSQPDASVIGLWLRGDDPIKLLNLNFNELESV